MARQETKWGAEALYKTDQESLMDGSERLPELYWQIPGGEEELAQVDDRQEKAGSAKDLYHHHLADAFIPSDSREVKK